ncbi:hypothetical protein ACKKBF_B11610 [Auxenochlorella protothecoides x Auxenochlorella symbiontica]
MYLPSLHPGSLYRTSESARGMGSMPSMAWPASTQAFSTPIVPALASQPGYCEAFGTRSRPGLRDLVPAVAYQPSEATPLSQVLRNAGKKALGGGIPGAAAMGIQVVSLMWLRTTVNYQYRYGMTTTAAMKTLYKEGGVLRFYRGVGPALIQGPMSRFGDTAANAGVLTLLNESASTKDLPIPIKTAAASAAAGGFRIFLMPVDALKTTMQVEGKNGIPILMSKIRTGGVSVLYHGALAAAAATWAGHFPWFATYNYLNEVLPQYTDLPRKLGRSAVIGFCASAISDTVSNSIRVVKTTKQTSAVPMTYPEVLKMVIKEDGILGLMGRGLKTKILANGLQGLLFSVLWRMGQDFYNKLEADKSK